MLIEKHFDTREEREAEYYKLQAEGTKHLTKRTTSISEKNGLQIRGKIVWILSYPIMSETVANPKQSV